MKGLREEIVRFIYSISQRERRRNFKLRKKIANLIKHLDDMPSAEERTKLIDCKKVDSFNKDIM